MEHKESLFTNESDIIPPTITRNTNINDFVKLLGEISFEARNVHRGATLFKNMINDGDTIWLGIAGAGIAGGMGGMVISLVEAGFIDVICSTGAQVYHDLHFAFDLPVKAISPCVDDDQLRRHGDTRIYDIAIRDRETLDAELSKKPLSSWEFNYQLGLWAAEKSKYPQRSFVVAAAQKGIPIFWDSMSNHSIAINIARTDREGYPIELSGSKDIFDSASIAYSSGKTSFVELGGGGPKNFIQQTGPTIDQILKIKFEGADRGLQIGTAIEKEGSLSSCTFGEAVTWGKYRKADEDKLVQIWGEYSVIFPILAAYVMNQCETRSQKNIVSKIPEFVNKLESAR